MSRKTNLPSADLPEVAPIFEEYVEASGLSSRIRFQPGKFFLDPMPVADLIMMGHILHDWNLEEKRMLIRKAYERRTLMASINMIETRAGFDYTGADCVGWKTAAEFREMRVEHLVGPDSMVNGIK